MSFRSGRLYIRLFLALLMITIMTSGLAMPSFAVSASIPAFAHSNIMQTSQGNAETVLTGTQQAPASVTLKFSDNMPQPTPDELAQQKLAASISHNPPKHEVSTVHVGTATRSATIDADDTRSSHS